MNKLCSYMGQRRWFVIYTKPKSEKKVSERLVKIGVEVFCPLQEGVRQWSDRKVRKKYPLFKSYVFVKLEPKNRAMVFEVPGVVKYLYYLGKLAEVTDNEIETIKDWLRKEEYGKMEVDHIENNGVLALQKGKWTDYKAIVEEVGKNKIVLRLGSIGCALKAHIN